MADGRILLNPGLDPRDYAADYTRDGIVQVPDLLHPDSIAWLADTLDTATPWSLSLWSPDGGTLMSPEALAAADRETLKRQVATALDRARGGFSFLYLSYAIIPSLLAGENPGHATHSLVEFLNSPPFLSFGRAITGEAGVTKIDAQATWFRPGDFLTLHDDTGVGERRAAYTIGLSRDWRADWGGQLLFHDPAGNVTRGFKPGFNVWTLFRTPQWHSVAPVAPYAAQKRLAITGWLRDDPPFRPAGAGA